MVKIKKTNVFVLNIFFILDLIKFIMKLQQQHSTKLTQLDQIHSKAIKQLEIQLSQQHNTIDGESV
jgi:hypothetical protein